ncbi:MAG: hypothetical protein WCK15_21200 [Pirellula sp.]
MTKNSTDSEPKKRALISLPFIAICLVVLGIGLFRGEWIMVQLMYWQEHTASEAKKKATSDWVKSSPGEPGVPSKGGLIPPEEDPSDASTTAPATTNPPADSAGETKVETPAANAS